MKKYFSKNYRKRLLAWLRQGTFYLLSIIVILLTILYLFNIINFFSGLVSNLMSISGIFILFFIQILEVKEYSIFKPNTPRNWLKSFPTIKPISIKLESGNLESIVSSIHVTTNPSKDASIEEKLDFLIDQNKKTQEHLSKIYKNIFHVNSELEKTTEQFENNLKIFESHLKRMIAGHVVGYFDKNLFGILLTFCGILLQVFRT